MALQVTELPRVFLHSQGGKNMELPDPNPAMPPEKVAGHYAGHFPTLATAGVTGPEIKDDKAVYTLTTRVGTKG